VNFLTQKECGYIAETLALAALQAGNNVIFDGTLSKSSWYVLYVRELRETFEHLKIGMIHVTAAKETILARALENSEVSGRIVNEREIESALDTIPESIELMKPEVDCFFQIENEDSQELVGDDWANFRSTFGQACSVDTATITRQLSPTEQKEANLSALRRPGNHRRTSLFISSEENHRMDKMKFYGPFAHIRETLDYEYHSNYTFERQMLQDAIIKEFLTSAVLQDKDGEICTTPTEPWIVFTAGAMGAG
jgi:hypothetical protein